MDPTLVSLFSFGVGKGIDLVDQTLGGDGSHESAMLTHAQGRMKLAALEETMRRAEGFQTQVLSSTKARMAATGFSSESQSYENFLTGMAEEFQKQNDFTRKQVHESVDLMGAAADLGDTSTAPKEHILDLVNFIHQSESAGK